MNKNDFAPVPPKGWNSYDYYDTAVNESQVKEAADFMAEHMKDAGWEYIVVDIQWYAKDAARQRPAVQYIPFNEFAMDEFSRLLPDPERFPSSAGGKGFKPLADYIHSKGLKFGIHIMRGIPRHRGSLQHLPVESGHVRRKSGASRFPGLLRFHLRAVRGVGRRFREVR